MILYHHNQEAYERVMQSFASHRRAAVVHATGTGKAYVMAAVAEHFSHPLILAPLNFILDEARKVNSPRAEYMTYPALTMLDSMPEGYDFIGLDEFHRAGAEQWGSAVRRLLKANPDAKVLGTSATPVRYLDSHRDMALELFGGNIVSRLSVGEAITQGILPDPIYVSALYQVEDSITHVKKCINDNDSYTEAEREDRLAKLREIKRSWDKSRGVSGIISKYFSPEMKRVIVFCSSIRDMDDIKTLLTAWLFNAGYKNLRFYRFDYLQTGLTALMDDYQKDDYDGLKIAISINMLNEGVHVPHVDAVIMLRSTMSCIIIEQQVGRCLTAGNAEKRPVVLDLVCNMDVVARQARLRPDTRDDFYVTYGMSSTDDVDETEGFPFEVIDSCKDFREFYLQIEDEWVGDPRWYNEFRPAFESFYDEHHRLPLKTEDKVLYNIMVMARNPSIYENKPHRIKWLREHGWNPERKLFSYTLEDDFLSIEAFAERHHRLPVKADDKDISAAMNRLRNRIKKKTMPEEYLTRYKALVDSAKDPKWFCKWLPMLESFYQEHGRLPYQREQIRMYRIVNNIQNGHYRHFPHREEWVVAHGAPLHYVRKERN